MTLRHGVGWGLAALREDAQRVCGALRGPLPLFTQSVGNGEIYAAAVALRFAVPPITLVSGYQHFLGSWGLGPGAFTSEGPRCGEA